VASALFAREVLVGRVNRADLVLMLRLKEVSVERTFRSSAFALILYHDVQAETLSSELFVLTLLTRLFCIFYIFTCIFNQLDYLCF
jgi:hypothetical protein